MKKVLIGLVGLLGLLTVIYFLGPKAEFDQVNSTMIDVNMVVEELDAYVESSERMVQGIKPDNHSRIVWADSVRKTEYAIVYLHGFSASPMESNPVHIELAKRFGMNLYIPRLSQHGLEDVDAFLQLTPSSLMESAKEALAIGQILGKKVILMSCSTGGTLSIYLAANFPDMIHAQILYSPNIEIADPTAGLITGPWGEVMLKGIVGDYRVISENVGTPIEQYWNLRYHSQGLLALQSLLDQTMTAEVFQKVRQPFLMGYYFESEEEQDPVVSVRAMRSFFESTSTPDDLKVDSPFSDVDNHVIASDLQSKDVESVIDITSYFLRDILKIEPVN